MINRPLLSLRQVTFSYGAGQLAALREIDFDVLPGTVNAILGPNGAGKSTLLHVVLGQLPPLRGEVLLDGRPLSSYSRRALSRTMGLVPQREYVPFDYPVLDFVLLGRTPHLGFLETPRQLDTDAALGSLRQLGLQEAWNRPVTALSGGEYQLVLIARALAQSPRVLLLDEPTSHLDLGNKKRVLRILRALADQQITILFTTHDPDSASAISDNIVLMRDGSILREGPLQQVFTTENLCLAYATPLRVIQADGHQVILLNMSDE